MILSLDLAHESLADVDETHLALIKSVKNYTLTSPERMVALINVIQYLVKNEIPGDIVECGVWRGGSMMLVVKMLLELKKTDYDLYLFDTFEGATKPTENDLDYLGNSMLDKWNKEFEGKKNLPASADFIPLDEVKKNLFSTGYPKVKIHFVKGKVEETIPKNSPEKISLLRLDTDWYESTKHELNNLFPKLTSSGILIIDDYGHFQGSKKAVDEYFEENKIPIFLSRIDYTGGICVKQ
jgi:hypothetical protein